MTTSRHRPRPCNAHGVARRCRQIPECAEIVARMSSSATNAGTVQLVWSHIYFVTICRMSVCAIIMFVRLVLLRSVLAFKMHVIAVIDVVVFSHCIAVCVSTAGAPTLPMLQC